MWRHTSPKPPGKRSKPAPLRKSSGATIVAMSRNTSFHSAPSIRFERANPLLLTIFLLSLSIPPPPPSSWSPPPPIPPSLCWSPPPPILGSSDSFCLWSCQTLIVHHSLQQAYHYFLQPRRARIRPTLV